jgi:small nuclear ribonucleoprotein (snRNP)-like protein
LEPRKKPINVLIKATGSNVAVILKGRGGEYRGKMIQADQYMNMMLKNADEYNAIGERVSKPGDVFIRGNNVLYICIEPTTPT